jgi:hypothetical protein
MTKNVIKRNKLQRAAATLPTTHPVFHGFEFYTISEFQLIKCIQQDGKAFIRAEV